MPAASPAALRGPLTRALRLFAALALTLAMFVGLPSHSASAEGDTVDTWRFAIQVDEQGVVHVTETLTYRFGSNSGRHGIIRTLVTREPWDDEQDAVYTISDITVSSPDASDEFRTSQDSRGRNRLLSIRIGSQDRTITADTATYTINYSVRGAMRSFADYDEFSWDLLSGEAPSTKLVNASVDVPGGAQQVACSSGPAGGTADCTSAAIVGERAVFTEQNRVRGDVTTVAVKIASAQVANPLPDLRPKASTSTRTDTAVPGAMAAVLPLGATAAAGAIGAFVVRRKGRDLRFQGVPPGVIPPPHSHVPVRLSDPIEVPVAFSPPRIPVAEAGLLMDGQVDVRETTATLVDLAVRGAIEMRQGRNSVLMLRLVDASRARAPHEGILMQSVFGGVQPGGWVRLSSRGSMDDAHRAMVTSVTNQVTSRGWFTDVPRTKAVSGCGGLLGIGFFLIFSAGTSLVTLWPLLATVVGIVLVIGMVSRRLRRGQRTAAGRAVTDQIEGFELYLTTAETEQLQFEEGEDIFSKYLPWAIIFDVADRWVNVCKPLVEAGRMPAPTWSGSTLGDLYLINTMLNSLNTVSLPAPSSSSGLSGTGFGGGSSFGGGGISSGGGGGGGSASSW